MLKENLKSVDGKHRVNEEKNQYDFPLVYLLTDV